MTWDERIPTIKTLKIVIISLLKKNDYALMIARRTGLSQVCVMYALGFLEHNHIISFYKNSKKKLSVNYIKINDRVFLEKIRGLDLYEET